jgi:hypothetical protein
VIRFISAIQYKEYNFKKLQIKPSGPIIALFSTESTSPCSLRFSIVASPSYNCSPQYRWHLAASVTILEVSGKPRLVRVYNCSPQYRWHLAASVTILEVSGKPRLVRVCIQWIKICGYSRWRKVLLFIDFFLIVR